MAVVTEDVGSSGAHDIDLTVSVDGMDITIESGDFKICNTEESLDSDLVISAQNLGNDLVLNVYVVKAVSDGEISLLVDEIELDGVDSGYDFEGVGVYKPLALLLYATIPSGTTDLAEVDINVKRYLPRPLGAQE